MDFSGAERLKLSHPIDEKGCLDYLESDSSTNKTKFDDQLAGVPHSITCTFLLLPW